MRINLTTKVIGSLAFFTIFMMFILGFLSITYQKNDLMDLFVDRSKSTAYSLDVSTSNIKDIQNKNELLLYIQKNLWLDSDIINIGFIVPQENSFEVLASNDISLTNDNIDTDNIVSFDQDILVHKNIKLDNQDALRVITPIHLSGQVIGTIQIDFSLKNINERVNATVMYLFINYIAVVLVLLIILSLIFKFIILNPISKINEGIKIISKNDYNYQIKLNSSDELGELANNYNKMTVDLKSSRKELDEYTVNLENKIKERTEELKNKLDQVEKMNRLMVNRELTMIELKKKNETNKK